MAPQSFLAAQLPIANSTRLFKKGSGKVYQNDGRRLIVASARDRAASDASSLYTRIMTAHLITAKATYLFLPHERRKVSNTEI